MQVEEQQLPNQEEAWNLKNQQFCDAVEAVGANTCGIFIWQSLVLRYYDILRRYVLIDSSSCSDPLCRFWCGQWGKACLVPARYCMPSRFAKKQSSYMRRLTSRKWAYHHGTTIMILLHHRLPQCICSIQLQLWYALIIWFTLIILREALHIQRNNTTVSEAWFILSIWGAEDAPISHHGGAHGFDVTGAHHAHLLTIKGDESLLIEQANALHSSVTWVSKQLQREDFRGCLDQTSRRVSYKDELCYAGNAWNQIVMAVISACMASMACIADTGSETHPAASHSSGPCAFLMAEWYDA